MNVTMQTENEEFCVLTERNVIPTTLNMSVTGDDQERVIVESLAARLIGDLVATFFCKGLRAFENGNTGKALEKAVRVSLADSVV